MKEGLIFIIFLIVLTSIFDTLRELILKSTINSLAKFSPSGLRTMIKFVLKLISIPWVWLGFLFSIISLAIWLFVLSKADLNFAFSVDSMHYIFIALASHLVLKEKVGLMRWLGTIFITAGIVLVTLS